MLSLVHGLAIVASIIAGWVLIKKIERADMLPLVPILWILGEITILVITHNLIFFPLILLLFIAFELIILYIIGRFPWQPVPDGTTMIIQRLGIRREAPVKKALKKIEEEDLPENERTKTGNFDKMIFLVPIIDKVEAILSLKKQTYNITEKTIVSEDRINMSVDIDLNYRIVNPLIYIDVENFHQHLENLAETALNSVIGNMSSDEAPRLILEISQKVKQIMTNPSDPKEDPRKAWGVEILSVAVKKVLPPDTLRKLREARKNAEERNRIASIDADTLSIQKEAEKNARIKEGEGEAAYFASQLRAVKEVGGEDAMNRLLYNMGLKNLAGANAIITSLPGAGGNSSPVDPNSVVIARAIENAAKANATASSDETEESP